MGSVRREPRPIKRWIKVLLIQGVIIAIVCPVLSELLKDRVHSWQERSEASTLRATKPEVPPPDPVIATRREPSPASRTQEAGHAALSQPLPVTPEEAAKRIDQVCSVEMRVSHTKTIEFSLLLNSKKYKDPGNFTVVVDKSVLSDLKQIGTDDPERYFFGKTIVATGKVVLYEGQPEIKVYKAEQIREIRKAR